MNHSVTDLRETPWDTAVFGINTAEILNYSDTTLTQCLQNKGLYTIKVDPLADKKLLDQHGFYYCDSLVTPVCKKNQLVQFSKENINISTNFNKDALFSICLNAFEYGRFHRDPYIEKRFADQRYLNWLGDLIENAQVYCLLYNGDVAGFIAAKENELVLHAVSESFRGKGLSKYWWSIVCQELFLQGHETLQSSVSATNLAVMNLYSSLGFRFHDACDVYHKLVR